MPYYTVQGEALCNVAHGLTLAILYMASPYALLHTASPCAMLYMVKPCATNVAEGEGEKTMCN